MRAHITDPQPSSKPDESTHPSNPLELAATMAVDRMLAIPTRTHICESQTLATANTLDLDAGGNNASAIHDECDSRLRDPIAGNHYQHAYMTDPTAPKELGRGGIGRVVLVFDTTLGRDVAMKELLPELLTGESVSDAGQGVPLAQRFLREARITGQLEHPNIVPVYELGRQPSGLLYYTMRVVRGRTLASAICSAATTSERLALINHFAGLCQAIAYAHSRGVIHRDIKPENVMIGEFGETFVLDWGLANIAEDRSPRSLRAAASLSNPPSRPNGTFALAPGTAESFRTQCGSIVGTPLYMSPERLVQGTDASSPTGDVWSLGIVLYYILTGKLPFTANSLGELVLKLQATDVATLVPDHSDIPRDLVAVAQRALARNPRLRYPSAREMARDIAAYQAGEKVTAYEYSSMELLRRFGRRNRPTVLVTIAALAALCVTGFSSYRRIVSSRDLAIAAELRATSGEQRAKASLSDVLVERARAESSEGDVASASLLAAGALELAERPDARGMLIGLANANRLESLPVPTFDQDCLQLEWNSALNELGCSNSQYLAIAATNTAQPHLAPAVLVPHATARSLASMGWLVHNGADTSIVHNGNRQPFSEAFTIVHPSGLASAQQLKVFAISDDSGSLEIWSVDSRTRIRVWHSVQPITSLAFHPTEPLLAIGGYRGEVYLWRWQDAATPALLGSAHSTVGSLAFAPKTTILATGDADGSLLVWDFQKQQVALAALRVSSAIVSLSFSPGGSSLAVATRSGIVDLLDTKNYERFLRSSTGFAQIRQLAFTTETELVGIADGKRPLHYRIRQATPRPRYISRGNVLSLSWSADQQDVLVAGLGDQGLCYLKMSDGTCGDRLPVRVGLVRKVVQSAETGLFLVAGTGGRIEIWDASEKLPRGYIDVPIPEVRDVALLEDPHFVAIVGNVPMLVVVNTSLLKIAEQQPLPAPGQTLLVMRSRRQMAIGLRNGHVILRSLATGKLEANLAMVSGWPVGMAISERQGWLSIAEDQGRIHFFELKSFKLLQSLSLDSSRLIAYAYSERLNLMAAAGESREVHVISTAQMPTITARLVEHQGTIRTLLFDDREERLYSAGDDGTIRLWTLGKLKDSAAKLRSALENESGMRLVSGRIIRDLAQ